MSWSSYSITSNDISDIQLMSDMSNVLYLINQIMLTIGSVIAPGDPGHVISAIFSKMLRSIMFISVSYSFRLELMFISFKPATGFISYAPAIPNDLLIKMTYPPTYGRFGMYHIPSRFIVNFWIPMLFLAMTFTVFIMLLLIEVLLASIKEQDLLYKICRRLRVIFQNFMIAQVYNYYGDILMYATLEMRTTKYYADLDWLSFSFSIIFILIGFFLLCGHLFLIKSYQNIKSKQGNHNPFALKQFQKNHEGTQIFYEGFKDSSLSSPAFLILYVFRAILIFIFLGCLFEHPLVQACLITCLTLGVGIYLIIVRPFKGFVNLVQQIVYELIFLVVNVMLVTIAGLDADGNTSISLRNSLSEVILFGCLAFGFLPSLFLIAKWLIAAIELFKRFNQPQGAKKEPAQVFPGDISSMHGLIDPHTDMEKENKAKKIFNQVALDETMVQSTNGVNDVSHMYHNGGNDTSHAYYGSHASRHVMENHPTGVPPVIIKKRKIYKVYSPRHYQGEISPFPSHYMPNTHRIPNQEMEFHQYPNNQGAVGYVSENENNLGHGRMQHYENNAFKLKIHEVRPKQTKNIWSRNPDRQAYRGTGMSPVNRNR